MTNKTREKSIARATQNAQRDEGVDVNALAALLEASASEEEVCCPDKIRDALTLYYWHRDRECC